MESKKNLIAVYQEDGSFIKEMYPRYALQRVMQKKAYWKNANAIQYGTAPANVIEEILKVGDIITVGNLMGKIKEYYAEKGMTAINEDAQAKGVISGGSRNGNLEYIGRSREWKRTA